MAIKRIIIALLLFFGCTNATWAAEINVTIQAGTMECGADPHNIRKTLSSLIGVKRVEILLADKTVDVTYDDSKSNVDALLSAMAGAGYAALLVGAPR
jgi:periplasmic mercuric ion binding protein